MDINLIKNYIEKSDFDENIIFNTLFRKPKEVPTQNFRKTS